MVLSLLLIPMAIPGQSSKSVAAAENPITSSELTNLLAEAEAGDIIAQYNLGLMYSDGNTVDQNYEEAVKWYTKAAEQGFDWAQNNLGYMFLEGHGVPQDYKEAVRWFKKAAEQRHSTAQYNLGCMYANGQGVPQDYKEAVRCYTKAAEQGDSGAQHNLGLMAEVYRKTMCKPISGGTLLLPKDLKVQLVIEIS